LAPYDNDVTIIDNFAITYIVGASIDYSNNIPAPELKSSQEQADHDDVLLNFIASLTFDWLVGSHVTVTLYVAYP
jgi:hypothetical protein